VRAVDGLVTVDVESVSGQHFVGRLRQHADDAPLGELHPGVLLLVTFDPSEREQLSLADDMAAVRTAFDQMLVRKGLLTTAQVELIRNGTKSHGVVTSMRTTGTGQGRAGLRRRRLLPQRRRIRGRRISVPPG
jgi:hypothetical protein